MTIALNLFQLVIEALDTSDTIIAVLKASPDVPGGLRFVDVSAALARAIGGEFGQRNNLALSDIAAPEAAATLDAIATAVAGQTPWRGDLVCQDHAERRVWLGCHLMPARTDGQLAQGQAAQLYVLVGRDITARRAEAHASKTINNLLARAFQAADVPLAIVNADGRFVMTNLSMDAQLGLMAGSLAGKLAVDFLAPGSRPLLLAERQRQIADGTPFQAEIDLQLANGQSVPVILSSATVEGLDTKRFGVLTTRPRDAKPPAATSIRKAVRTEAPITHQVAGRLRFIDLEEVREALKDQWDSLGKRAMDAGEHTIRKRLTAADTLNRDAERGFTICFATGSEAEATLRATAIAREVRRHLIGLGEDENALAMQVVVQRIPLTADKPAGLQIAQQLDVVADQGLLAARAPLAPPRVQPIYRAASGTAFAAYVSPTLRPTTPGSTILPESTANQDLAPIQWALALDTTKPLYPLLIDIKFDLFVRRDRTEAFMDLCAKLAPQVRPHLNFLLTDLPVGVTTSLMQDITRRLKPFCGGLGWHADQWDTPNFDIRTCPLAWAIVDLGAWQGPSTSVPERLKRLSSLLTAHGIKTVARHVASMDAITALHPAGIYGAALRNEPNGA
jgi:PAS domain-containing protein